MNFYKHYIGDYQRDTSHLSLNEHGAYRLTLDIYYATERPLPGDKETLYRILRAITNEERKAVDSVIQQFWTETDHGYVNHRASKEIEKASKQAKTNRRIAEEREAARKANDNNTKNETKPPTNRVTNDQPNQTPDTRHQTKEQQAPDGALPPASSVARETSIDTTIPDSCKRKFPEEIEKAFYNYNICAEEFGLPKAAVLTSDRVKKLKQRLAEHGLEGWNKALLNIETSDFCRGKNERNWRVTLDFMLQPAGLNKLIEGAYGPEAT